MFLFTHLLFHLTMDVMGWFLFTDLKIIADIRMVIRNSILVMIITSLGLQSSTCTPYPSRQLLWKFLDLARHMHQTTY